MTKHCSSLIANIGSQSANDTLKNALKNTLKESGKSGGDDIVEYFHAINIIILTLNGNI
jgi:hypothetical protein